MDVGARRASAVFVCAGMLLCMPSRDACADSPREAEDDTLVSLTVAMDVARRAAVPDEVAWVRDVVRHDVREDRPAGLAPLYFSLAVLQGLDVHSTLAGVSAGRTEANPVLAPLTRDPALLIGTKVAIAAATIALSERLWRRHRTAALVLMVAINVAHAVAVAHNYRKLGR